VPFTTTQDDWFEVYDRYEGKCFYTDIPMVWSAGHGKDRNAVSVDKIIPEVGYARGNIVFCSNRANLIKNNMTLEEMQKWTPSWYTRIQDFRKEF
jgi:hypothetical protein